MKTVFILIGPKGSGKSYIGKLMEKEMGISFLAVEPIFLSIKGNRDNRDPGFIKEGFLRLEEIIINRMRDNERIVFESTGLTENFNLLLKRLQADYRVKLIRVRAALDLCLQRIAQRDSAIHIPISQELIQQVNRASVAVEFNYDLNIENDGASDVEIIASIRRTLL